MKKFCVYYFIFLFFVLSIFASGVIDSQDGFQYLAVTRNIYYQHRPTTPPNEWNTGKNINMNVYTGKDGLTYGPTGLGYSIAMLPAVFLTDLVYKYYNIPPPEHFPLESDWLILLLASFTNCFFAAILGVIIFVYLIDLGLSKKNAIFTSLVSIFCTNLFAYSKHSFAHMMFITLLVASFYLLRRFSLSKNVNYLIGSGIALGVATLTYNQTVILATPSYLLYFYLLYKPSFYNFKELFLVGVKFLFSILPFALIYIWFENTRAPFTESSSTIETMTETLKSSFKFPPIPLFIEGIYGNLISPGRGVILYSPILLAILIFWHKIKPKIIPELLLFIVLFVVYIIFYALPSSPNNVSGVGALWHGELSWGPRYILPVIPFGMIIFGNIYQYLSKKAKFFIIYPLFIFGLYIEVLGAVMPYQVKLHNLDFNFFVNQTEYTASLYSNLLPRYSPIISMTKNLVKMTKLLPKTIDHGPFNVKFYDGIDFPFNVGPTRWRVIEKTGYISFDLNNKEIQTITLDLINHPLSNSSSSAIIRISLNNHQLLTRPEILTVRERKSVNLPIKKEVLQQTDNQLIIEEEFDDKNIEEKHLQIIALQGIYINGIPVNMESLDFPYISDLGKVAGINYQNYGGTNNNPWKSWNIHTQIFERVPDFWWVKAVYYWDFPKQIFAFLFIINVVAVVFFGIKVFRFKQTR